MTKRITDSNEVKSFIEVAQRFCAIFENLTQFSEIQIYQLSYQLIPELCIRAMQLPEIQQSPFYKSDHYDVWKNLYDELNDKLTYSTKGYNHIFDPLDPNDKQSTPTTICDDLADIYSNMLPGLRDFQKSDASLRRGIVWGWKFDYENHWGDHAINAFRVIHHLIYEKIEDTKGDYIGLNVQR